MHRSRGKRRWKLIAAAIGFGVMVLCNLIPLFTTGSALVSLLIVIAAVVPAAFFSLLVILLDRNEREPSRVLLMTFLWGAVVAVFIAGIVNSIVEAVAGKLAAVALSAPLIEETSKAAVLLLLFFYLRDEFDNVLDGIVYGGLVGIGFAMTENFGYFADAYRHGNMAGLAQNVYIRVVLGGLGHAAYTATTGAGLGYARETNSRFMKVFAPFLGWCLAVFQHFAWNGIRSIAIGALYESKLPTTTQLYVTSPLLGVLFTGPALATLFLLVVLAWRREAGIIAQQLWSEVQAGWITPDEYARLSSASRRRSEEWRVLRTSGSTAWHTIMDLDQAATELAFRKWHRGRGETPKRGQKDASDDDLRQRIQALRAHLATVAPAGGVAPYGGAPPLSPAGSYPPAR